MPKANLAQVEFFHADFSSEETLVKSLLDRWIDGLRMSLGGIRDLNPGIKSTVRFYDYSGKLTRIALLSEWVESRRSRLYEKVRAPLYLSGWRADLINLESRWLIRAKRWLCKKAASAAVAELHAAVLGSRKVAVERYDHKRSFTLLRADESHELLEKATKAQYVWLFVFRPNDLLSSTNASVASMTI